MGYCIHYDPGKNHKYPSQNFRPKKHIGLVLICFAVAVLIILAYTDNGALLKDWLLPGDPEQFTAAVSAFTESLRAGDSARNAITAFCMEILENANIPH